MDRLMWLLIFSWSIPVFAAPPSEHDRLQRLEMPTVPADGDVLSIVDDIESKTRARAASALALAKQVEGIPLAIHHGLGLACKRLRRRQCAREHFSEVIASGTPLAEVSAWRLAETLEKADPDTALWALDQIDPSGPMGSRGVVKGAELLLRTGDALGALERLAEFEPTRSTDYWRRRNLELEVDALAASGQRAAMARAGNELRATFPKAASTQRFVDTLPLRERLYHLVDHRLSKKNAKKTRAWLLDELRKKGKKHPLRWHLRYALSWVDQQRGAYEIAATRLDEILRLATYPELLARAGLAKAKTLRRRNRDIESADQYVQVATIFPGFSESPKALREATFLYHLRGEHERALGSVNLLLTRYPESSERTQGLWKKGWVLYRLGRFSAARGAWKTLAQEAPNAFGYSHGRLAEQLAYWRARALEEEGLEDAALAAFAKVVTAHPLSYYSQLAHGRMRTLAPERAARLLTRPHGGGWPLALESGPTVLPAHGVLAPAAQLMEHGLKTEAWRYLQWLLWTRTLPEEALDAAATLALDVGGIQPSHRVLLRRAPFSRQPLGEHLRRWHLAFPVAFRSLVEESAAAFDLDPFLILAVIRHESGFNPRARSWAGAEGLIQVMPATATYIARRLLGERRPRRGEMYEPSRNLRLGSRYLRHVLDRVDGNVTLAAAGYNAGAGAIAKWRRRWRDLETDELIEELPYREARGYSKQVTQAWGVYRYLYASGHEPMAWRIEVPRAVYEPQGRPLSHLVAEPTEQGSLP